MKRPILPLFAALSLTACATAPTIYQPAMGPRAVGYVEQRIEPGRYLVSFQGGPGAPATYVADLALLRAAELTIADGYDWFLVSDRYIQGQDDRGPRVGVGVGGADYGRRSGLSVGVGTSFRLGGGASLTASLEIFMGSGSRPAGADVYDARGLRDTVRARI